MSSDFRILHCLHTPTGGLFRHVHDLALGQAELGAEVGIVCNNVAGDANIDVAMSRLNDNCALGVTRIAMPSRLDLNDWRVWRKIAKLGRTHNVNVLHGHGTKGGIYARLAGRSLRRKKDTKVVYTPHGDVIRTAPSSFSGKFYVAIEKKLAPLTDGFLFDSMFSGNRYVELVGKPSCPARVIYNGLHRHEFYNSLLADDAVDFLFVGTLSRAKGVDLFLEALAAQQVIFPGRALIVGSGPDEKYFKRQAKRLGLSNQVTFSGPTPTHTAFVRARCVVVPSRAESFPYILLEAAAAQMPIIATSAGGIPEMIGDIPMPLVPPGDKDVLAGQLRAFLSDPRPFLSRAAQLQSHVANAFSAETMTREVVDFYISELGAGLHGQPRNESLEVS